jgi:hypothetical protein
LVLAPLEKRFLPKIVSASTWKNFSDLAFFQIERREAGWRIAPQMKCVGNTILWFALPQRETSEKGCVNIYALVTLVMVVL